MKTLIALITIAWVSLIGVLIAISTIILPLAQGIESSLAAGLLRVALSLALFAVWLVWLFELAFYASLMSRRGRGEQK
jgi:hypothetical protein